MLYALVISVCLIADPDDCRTYEQPVIELSANPSSAFVHSKLRYRKASTRRAKAAVED